MDIEELERIKEEVSNIEDEKERKKLEKQIAKIERQLGLNNTLTGINNFLGGTKKQKKDTYEGYYTEQEKELMTNEGYEPYQLDEEEQDLEDDDLYEKGED